MPDGESSEITRLTELMSYRTLGIWKRARQAAKLTICLLACGVFTGCSSSQSSAKEAHVKQIEEIIAKAGGEAVILKESKTLFARGAFEAWEASGVLRSDKSLEGLAGIQSLGDVFRYEAGHIRIRVHNSHSDTYFIYLLDPGKNRPENFECIVGNVGFITKREQGANQL